MFVRSLSTQIPYFWDAIKFGASKTAELSGSRLQLYLEDLLIALLDGRAQCFIRMDKDKMRLQTVGISRINYNKVTGEKNLNIESLYAFEKSSLEEWMNDFETFKKFAKQINCERITAYTSNPRILALADKVGLKELHKILSMEVE